MRSCLGSLACVAWAFAAEIRTVPETPVWVADGATIYELQIMADNTDFSEGTAGIDWRLDGNAVFDFITAELPQPEQDFFDGFDPILTILRPPGAYSGRSVWGAGPIRTGVVATYRFTVPSSTPAGNYAFEISESYFFNQSGDEQSPLTIQSVPVRVVAPCPEDLDGDGVVEVDDAEGLFACLTGPEQPVTVECDRADSDDDADCDLADFAQLQKAFGRPCD